MSLKAKFSSRKDKKISRILYDEQGAANQLSNQVLKLLPDTDQEIALVCIGTDRSTGDSLGPLVGTILSKKKSSFRIYGTLDSPIHAVNLEKHLDSISSGNKHPFIIAVDACLGRHHHVGSITLGSGPIKPGAAVNKHLPEVGDIHIAGIVNVSGFMEYFVLQNTRLNIVMKMAEVIAEGLYLASLRRKIQNRTVTNHSLKSI